MSEINKPENDNADLKCPFNPDQYKAKVTVSYKIDNDIAAPIGSLPWALIQVYTGKLVNRSVWNASNEYIQLTAKNDGSTPIHIEKHDQQSFPYAWEPTPEDLMACDWELVKSETKPKPDDCMLSFDLNIGTGRYYNANQQDWGYLTQGGGEFNYVGSTFGTLTKLQHTIGIGNILMFILNEAPIGTFWGIQLQADAPIPTNLLSKNLEVMADGSIYNLGVATSNSIANEFYYQTGDGPKLGDLLKKNLGKTLHLCFNWK
ncbi:Thoeris anti-defense Tad2 family protein [Xenorhabdus bovienii]|uniref:Thoeris anti-defense Tad2 family protein n=1 Tax=Xenorhabdus bovienii TaxID=40576 RepID=UPI003DA2B3BA